MLNYTFTLNALVSRRYTGFILRLLVTSVALGVSACTGESESSSGSTGSPVLKDYVRKPLDSAEEISEDLESRNQRLDDELNVIQEDGN